MTTNGRGSTHLVRTRFVDAFSLPFDMLALPQSCKAGSRLRWECCWQLS